MNNIPYLIEIALLLLIAFLIGCFISYLLRCFVFTPKTATDNRETKAAKAKATNKEPIKEATPKKETPANEPNASSDGKPLGLSAPRDGKGDDLKRIKGIGPKIEKTLNELGIYHFDQIASWSRKTVKWVDNYLSFKGRIDREKWIKQAKLLAEGKETEFSKRVDKGSVPSSKGKK